MNQGYIWCKSIRGAPKGLSNAVEEAGERILICCLIVQITWKTVSSNSFSLVLESFSHALNLVFKCSLSVFGTVEGEYCSQ